MDPLKKFDRWFEEAKQAGEPAPEKMILATASRDAKPSARFLLLKGRVERDFYFYTNYLSRKASDLDSNPYASIVLYWDKLEKQVRIEGRVRRAPAEASDAYWATRPRESQLGAWASKQSSMISNRSEVEAKISEYTKKFEGCDIPRPEFWGGYILEAEVIELWTGRQFRVHDREVFRWTGSDWAESLLSP